MTEQQSDPVTVWRTIMSVIAAANIVIWALVAAGFPRTGRAGAPRRDTDSTRGWQILLSALFVFGCAFRSFLPRVEGLRIGLSDAWLSSAMIGRSVATVAELAFAAQWTLVLKEWTRGAGASSGLILARLLLPLIVLAECFSWYSALTTNFLGSVVEESIWTATSLLVMAILTVLWLRAREGRRSFLRVALVFNVAYVLFMCMVDVPMYVTRWRADQAAQRPYVSVIDGVRDAQTRRFISLRWEDWRVEIPWMSLYFSAGVWLSIGLIRAPRFNDRASWSAAPPPMASASIAGGRH